MEALDRGDEKGGKKCGEIPQDLESPDKCLRLPGGVRAIARAASASLTTSPIEGSSQGGRPESSMIACNVKPAGEIPHNGSDGLHTRSTSQSCIGVGGMGVMHVMLR